MGKIGVQSTENKNEEKSFLEMSDGSDSDDIFANLGVDLKQKKRLDDVKEDSSKDKISGDDDIFSTSTKDKADTKTESDEDSKQPKTEKADSKKKAPIGGVSLFAGFNPANIFKKKFVSSDDEADDDVLPDEELSPDPKESGKDVVEDATKTNSDSN